MVGDASGTVMAAIDTKHQLERLIIADVTADDSWVSIRVPAAVRLDEWR